MEGICVYEAQVDWFSRELDKLATPYNNHPEDVEFMPDLVVLAFEDLCQRFEYFLSRRRQLGDEQRGMIILDKSTRETSLQQLSREFRKAGTRWGSLRNIADTPFFVDSRASRLIQIADHVAYAVFRRYNSGDAQYMDIIASRFDEADGIYHGLSHKHTERLTCTCHGCLSRRLSGKAAEASK